ncbi:MAG: envelope stress response membrane protein PspC, partial [Pseudomonadota bacterium]
MDDPRNDPGNGVNPKRFYRDSENGKLLGVCAGIADYFGFSVSATRWVWVLATIFAAQFLVIVYFVIGFLVPVKPHGLYRDKKEERFWRDMRNSPSTTFSEVRHRYRQLEVRAQRLERYVTSPRFNLDQEFRDLEKDA